MPEEPLPTEAQKTSPLTIAMKSWETRNPQKAKLSRK